MSLIEQENAAFASAVTASISALCALIAIFAVRNTNKIARAGILPFITVSYEKEYLLVKNEGKGAALNFRFLPLLQHYTDLDTMIYYMTEPISLSPGKERTIKVISKAEDKGSPESDGEAFDILFFAKETKTIDAVFEDATNKAYALRLFFNRDWQLETQRYVTYGLRLKLRNWLGRLTFKLTRKRRVKQRRKKGE